MVHKKEEDTYHHTETLMKEMLGFLSPGRGLPLLLIPEYSGINKEQRIPDRSKKHTGSLLLNAFLTIVEMSEEARLLISALPPPLCDQGGQVTVIISASIADYIF